MATKGRDELRPTGPAWEAAEAYGFDMSILAANLTRSPPERLRVASVALRTGLALRSALCGDRAGAGAEGSLLTRLLRAEVQFVIVGGAAGFAHGVDGMLEILQVCCAFSAESLLRVQACLASLHPVHRKSNARRPLELTAEGCARLGSLYLGTDDGSIDLLSAIAGVGDFQEVKRNSVEIELDAGACRVLSLDALIRSKEAMDRPRDREAVLQLKAIRERLSEG